MKNDSGHFGPDNLVPPPAGGLKGTPPLRHPAEPSQPRTKDESREWADRFRAASQGPIKYLPAGDEFSVTVNAWASIPKPIRFAVWLWAISVILGFVAGLITLAVLFVGGAFAISGL
jgi:hypothetical protein